MTDITFTALARRAALYPIVLRRGQMQRLETKKEITTPDVISGSLGWLLLNTLEVNRILIHATPRKT